MFELLWIISSCCYVKAVVLSGVFSAREIAKRDAEKEDLVNALSRSCEELTSLRTQISMVRCNNMLIAI